MRDQSQSHGYLSACLALTLIFTMFRVVSADDFAQWRGPNRDGISQERGLLQSWPEKGPQLLWKVSDAGQGYSTPAVVGGRLYTLGSSDSKDEFVQARNAHSGDLIWSRRIGKVGKPNQKPNYAGARSTPTVDGEFLYALGSDGDLVCLTKADGQVKWSKNLLADFGGKSGSWAYSESPLVDGDAVVCTPGGTTATLLSLNKATGDVLWKCPQQEGDEAAYSSIIVVSAAGKRQYVQLLQKGLVGVEAKTGRFLWRYGRPISRFNANIPTPVAGDGYVYTASAGTGGGAVKLVQQADGVAAKHVYFEGKLPTAIGGTIKLGELLYGTAGQAMTCLEVATGKVLWSERAIGAASLTYADGRLYLHGENGSVALMEPSAQGYREHGRFTPSGGPQKKGGQKSWAYPVVADGRLFIRDWDTIWCYQVK
ncbi:MAG TPA: PQQ-binding-like beta-propeller repeat protein [Pirellulaceae bacterium]|nr:PQQ-binding-like beta-propeller repeat protein [Pirellulaceae bacterium]